MTRITKREKEILRLLKKYYKDAKCALNYKNAFELLIATILSAQCTDKRVNLVTQSLFKDYPNPKSFARSKLKELERKIHSTGFFKNKAKNIKSASQKILENFKGRVPSTMEELLTLPGVGRKTANVVLGNAHFVFSGIVVDTHVKRLSYRLGFTENKNPELIEKDLMQKVSKKDWIQFSHWMIQHGRLTCGSRKPKCQSCFLEDVCLKKGVV